MTLPELWELFPIELAEHNQGWKNRAMEEIQLLHTLLYDFSPRISHVGSTAIPAIKSKPIIDIIVETDMKQYHASIRKKMEDTGYICMSESCGRMSFNKGYTPDGYAERVFHIHIRDYGDNDEILFRDYLNAHPEVAREYETLKISLLLQYKNNRDGYTMAKTDFVRRIMEKARKLSIIADI